MNTFKRISFATVVLGLVLTMTAFSDTRVIAELVKEDITFLLGSNNNIKAQFRTTENRTNLVIVNSETKRVGDYEYREVWSSAYRGIPIDAKKLEQLLLDNGQQKVGGWRVLQGEKWIVIYSVRVSANADGSTLRAAMQLCATKADALEKEWGENDEF